MPIIFKHKADVNKILEKIRRVHFLIENPNLEVGLSREEFNLLVDNIIDPIRSGQKEFEWNGIKIKTY
jgi:hypothetical protein